MPWRELTITLPAHLTDGVSQFLEDQGAQAVTFAEAGEEPLFEPKPGQTPLWQIVRLTALFSLDADIESIARRMKAHHPGIDEPTLRILEDQPWERLWLEHFKPLNFGSLWVCPSGQPPPTSDGVCLELDPGLAFGTGTHATTALCLEWLGRQDLNRLTVIDYGCGSGILAIAALLLGAQKVIACDIDPQALTATRDNAAKNQVAERLECCYPQDMPEMTADLLLANILAGPLIDMASDLAARIRVGGRIILSGILEAQVGEIIRAYQPCQIQFETPTIMDQWARLTGTKRPE